MTPITTEDLWARAARDLSEKPYKALGIDLLKAGRQKRDRAVDIFIEANHALESAQLDDPQFGAKAFQRLRAAAADKQLERHLPALAEAVAENHRMLGETLQAAHRRRGAPPKRDLDERAEPALSNSPEPR